ncbi:hypothetical protein [Nakamurella aerolata]|uniref:Uncharacterized protein n=1 Tax=Nakamurella aerolata TaxID=1656892 RepID=A0A849A839_9ACTN|nr:hypothetical protein [Nakamurella aerolata]NNG35241.1 hypothetical protein [Nakamurella aerolata]
MDVSGWSVDNAALLGVDSPLLGADPDDGCAGPGAPDEVAGPVGPVSVEADGDGPTGAGSTSLAPGGGVEPDVSEPEVVDSEVVEPDVSGPATAPPCWATPATVVAHPEASTAAASTGASSQRRRPDTAGRAVLGAVLGAVLP